MDARSAQDSSRSGHAVRENRELRSIQREIAAQRELSGSHRDFRDMGEELAPAPTRIQERPPSRNLEDRYSRVEMRRNPSARQHEERQSSRNFEERRSRAETMPASHGRQHEEPRTR